MTKSTITRERLEQLANFKGAPVTRQGEQELARMALAAMDSEPVAYWRKALRADGFCYADGINSKRFHDENPPFPLEDGDYWEIIPLYRHSQAAPVVPISFDEWSRKCALQITLCYPDFREKAQYIWDSARETIQPAPVVPVEMNSYKAWGELKISAEDCQAWSEGWNACRAAMLQAQSSDDGEPTDDERIMAIEGINNCERCGDEGWIVGEMGITRCACSQGGTLTSDGTIQVEPVTTANKVGNSPVIPDTLIPVSERMPENDESKPIAIFTGKCLGQGIFIATYDDNGFFDFWEGMEIFGVTHWMPLPAAPQEVKGE